MLEAGRAAGLVWAADRGSHGLQTPCRGEALREGEGAPWDAEAPGHAAPGPWDRGEASSAGLHALVRGCVSTDSVCAFWPHVTGVAKALRLHFADILKPGLRWSSEAELTHGVSRVLGVCLLASKRWPASVRPGRRV